MPAAQVVRDAAEPIRRERRNLVDPTAAVRCSRVDEDNWHAVAPRVGVPELSAAQVEVGDRSVLGDAAGAVAAQIGLVLRRLVGLNRQRFGIVHGGFLDVLVALLHGGRGRAAQRIR